MGVKHSNNKKSLQRFLFQKMIKITNLDFQIRGHVFANILFGKSQVRYWSVLRHFLRFIFVSFKCVSRGYNIDFLVFSSRKQVEMQRDCLFASSTISLRVNSEGFGSKTRKNRPNLKKCQNVSETSFLGEKKFQRCS